MLADRQSGYIHLGFRSLAVSCGMMNIKNIWPVVLSGALTVLMLVSSAVAPGSTVQAGEHCFANWSEAAPVVAQEKLASAKDIHDLVRKKLSAKVVRITLCKGAQGYEYRLVTFETSGKARKLTLNAKRPVVR